MGESLASAQPGIYIWGGEPTVILPDNPGQGGRNQSLALAISEHLLGKTNITLLVAGTDGSDGPTEAAGELFQQAVNFRLVDAFNLIGVVKITDLRCMFHQVKATGMLAIFILFITVGSATRIVHFYRMGFDSHVDSVTSIATSAGCIVDGPTTLFDQVLDLCRYHWLMPVIISRFKFFDFIMAITVGQMIVHQTGRLHESVTDRAADKGKTTFLQIL